MSCQLSKSRIQGGVGAAKARRLCPAPAPGGVDFNTSPEASSELFKVSRETSPVVEGL